MRRGQSEGDSQNMHILHQLISLDYLLWGIKSYHRVIKTVTLPTNEGLCVRMCKTYPIFSLVLMLEGMLCFTPATHRESMSLFSLFKI